MSIMTEKPTENTEEKNNKVLPIPLQGRYETGFQALLGKKAPLLDGPDGNVHRARGFRCDICKRSFSDDRSYIAHTHSPEHLVALGIEKTAQTVTDVERVEARIQYNVARLHRNKVNEK